MKANVSHIYSYYFPSSHHILLSIVYCFICVSRDTHAFPMHFLMCFTFFTCISHLFLCLTFVLFMLSTCSTCVSQMCFTWQFPMCFKWHFHMCVTHFSTVYQIYFFFFHVCFSCCPRVPCVYPTCASHDTFPCVFTHFLLV